MMKFSSLKKRTVRNQNLFVLFNKQTLRKIYLTINTKFLFGKYQDQKNDHRENCPNG